MIRFSLERPVILAVGIIIVCLFGLADVPLSYGVGWYPLSWPFLTFGLLFALRLLIVDDLIGAIMIAFEGIPHRS